MTVKAWTFMPRALATAWLRRTATLRPVKAERATVEVERVKADIFVIGVSVTCCEAGRGGRSGFILQID